MLQETSGELRDRGSRFLAFAFPMTAPATMDERLAALRKQHYDARHHCHAWRLGPLGDRTFAHDDGEPAHTAGTPILAAIRSASLTDVGVVVVRYFGGTKLGVRGLIEAYRGATEAALALAQRDPVIPRKRFSLDFAYEQTSDINRLLHPFSLTQVQAAYTDRCLLVWEIEAGQYPLVTKVLEDQGYAPKFEGERY